MSDDNCADELNNVVGEGCAECDTDFYLVADKIACNAITNAANCDTQFNDVGDLGCTLCSSGFYLSSATGCASIDNC